jgi:hypothetical protein
MLWIVACNKRMNKLTTKYPTHIYLAESGFVLPTFDFLGFLKGL